MDIDRAIGLFHVHAHKQECFYRFASSFIPGAGIVAGEILESLWSKLNMITTATRTATLAHRAEVIDDHASDLNRKKALGIRKSQSLIVDCLLHHQFTAFVLCDRFGLAKDMVHKTSEYYTQLTSTIPARARTKWEQEITSAERRRLEEPRVMDIIGTQQTDVAARSSADPNLSGTGPEWLTLALSIEERQYVV